MKEGAQLGFDMSGQTVGQVEIREGGIRIPALITMSDIEKNIYREDSRPELQTPIGGTTAIGRAIDFFLVPANFIYRFRDDYCFEPHVYKDWDLTSVFGHFYPTGYGRREILEILEKHRPSFWNQQNPINPANRSLERRNIKRKLIPLWEEIGRRFNLDFFRLQGVMEVDSGLLLSSTKTASEETTSQIGMRIVNERFDALVDDDKNYTYIAQPDCLLVFEVDGQPHYIQVRPDYLKRLREKRKTTAKRHIVTKRIVGDFKDSSKKDFADFSKPFGKTMLAYDWLLSQIGERFKWNQRTWISFPNGQKRRVFLIPQEVNDPIPRNSVQSALEFLREDGEQIFSPLPALSVDLENLARDILEKALLLSQKSRLTT